MREDNSNNSSGYVGESSKRPERQRIASKKKPLALKKILAAIAIVLTLLIVGSLVIRGSILGWQIRGDKKNDGSLIQNSKEQPSYACSKASAEEVSRIMGGEVERFAGIFPDRTEPSFISSCSYRTKAKPSRSLTIVVKDNTDDNSAKNEFNEAKKREGSESIKKLGDEASFTPKSKQIVVRNGKRITRVTVGSQNDASSTPNKDVVTAVSALLVSSY